MNKLCSTAKKLDTACRVLFWILIVCGIVALAGIILPLVTRSTADPSAPINILDLDFVSLQLAQPTQEAAAAQQTASLVAMVMLIVGLALGIYWLRIIRNILKPMTQAMPFHETVSVNLKKLAWVELIAGAVISCVELAVNHLIVYGYNLKELLLNEKITEVTFNYSFDINFIFIAAVLFLLSYIFRYGAQLQQLSDETL